MSTSFVQYKYCSLCRTSCKKLRKHVHASKHQEIVKNIITKFLKKISEARSCIDHPLIKDASWIEAERRVWCYCCSSDVDRHLRKITVIGECVVVNARFLGHITRKDHSENTAKFLKDNLVDMKRTSEFLLDEGVFLRFLESAEKASLDFLNEKNINLKKDAYAIRRETAFHHHAMNQGLLEQKQQQSKAPAYSSRQERSSIHLKKSTADQEDGEWKKTDQAFGDGLTAIDRSNEDDSQGNIHSNAVPPWLRKNDQGQMVKDGLIGPSIDDWTKHKKLEQKRKLPTCRVGAKFDHKTSQEDEWLPNFGGVWSHRPRTKSSAHFRKRLNSSHQKQSKSNESHDTNISHTPELLTSSYLSSNNTDMKNHFHQNVRNDDTFSNLQQEYNSPVPTVPLVSFGAFNGFGGTSDSQSEALPSFCSSNIVKPYVSKRRKVRQSAAQSTAPSSAFHDSFYQMESVHANQFHHPISGCIRNERDVMITHENRSASSSTRLLQTPVLKKKK